VVSLAVGSALASTTAMGDGLPVELAADRPLLAVAAGSAIGVVESAIAARIAAGAAEKTRLLFGVRSVAETPIRPTIDRFRAAGVRVELCCSDEAPNEPDAYFGWVQTRLPAHADWLAGGYVFVGGHPELVAELRARAAEWGTDASRVHTNH
jgi:ferredoxin-NADP reductase